MKTELLTVNDENIKKAGRIIADGGLVAFPTETVYGLGANALNDEAVKNIYKAKGRPSDNPLIVHVADKADIARLVKEIPPKAEKLINAFFPGALTIIMNKSDLIGKTVAEVLIPLPFVCRRTKLHINLFRKAVVPLPHRVRTPRVCRRLQGLSM